MSLFLLSAEPVGVTIAPSANDAMNVTWDEPIEFESTILNYLLVNNCT
jgi:hypothetical protein